MERTYESITKLVSAVLEPAPYNQLGMPDYCRRILCALSEAKKLISELEDSYRNMMRSYDMSIDEEF